MNQHTLAGQWDQLKGKIKQQWGKLTDDDMSVIEGKKDELVGKLKERYGYTEEKARSEIQNFYSSSNIVDDDRI